MHEAIPDQGRHNLGVVLRLLRNHLQGIAFPWLLVVLGAHKERRHMCRRLWLKRRLPASGWEFRRDWLCLCVWSCHRAQSWWLEVRVEHSFSVATTANWRTRTSAGGISHGWNCKGTILPRYGFFANAMAEKW